MESENRERRLRMRVARILADEGLRLDPGLGIQIVAGGEIVVSDPVLAGDNPHTRVRNAVHLPGAYSDDGLTTRIAAFARESIRRKIMSERHRHDDDHLEFPPGWTSLAHPVAIALMARIGAPLDAHPGSNSENVAERMKPTIGTYETVRTWDLLSINISATIAGTYISLETKPGQCWIQIDGQYPETVADTLPGKPVTAALGIPPLARDDTPGLVRRHALAVDAAIAASRISDATNMGNHLSIELEPMTWLPYGPAPDEMVERTLALNFERH